MKLMRAAGRNALAGFVTVLSFGIAANAWAQTSECPGSSVSGRARAGLVPSTLLSVIDDRNASVEALQQVARDCQQILTQSQRGSIDALMCVARAQIKLADRGVDAVTNYGYARCHAYRAYRLSSGDARARASAVRAEALVGLIGANSGSADAYSQELLGSDVHNSSAPAAVHRAVAQIYTNRNDITRALAEARGDLQGTDRALALINISSKRGGDTALLTEALRADSRSVAVNAALGVAYATMPQPNWPAAYDRLLQATYDGATVEPGYENLQEQAFLYRSVLASSGNPQYGTIADAIRFTSRAGNTAPALRQGCLVRLVAGGEEVFQAPRDSRGDYIRPRDSRGRAIGPIETTDVQRLPAYDHCNRLTSTAEGQLLLGMFWLRYAQLLGQAESPDPGTFGERPWRAAVDNATRYFQNGSTSLTDNRAKLGWPGHADVTYRAMFDYGQALTGFIQSYCRSGTGPAGELGANGAPTAQAQTFFDYKAVLPNGMSRRCRPA